jgi:type II secretory pathway pseudopilin PulG
MERRKKSFVLLEIIISLGLLSILLSFLFSAMASGIKVEAKIENARRILMERQHLQSRLQDLFLSIHPLYLPPIYTKTFPREKKESLIVCFDHGIDPDPSFSGPLLGRIYLDKDHNLVLCLWPIEKGKQKAWRKEILLERVSHFQFQFLGEKQKKEDEAVTASLAWHKLWPKKRLETPSMIRLSVTQDKTNLSWAFFLSQAEPFVTYWQEGYRS